MLPESVFEKQLRERPQKYVSIKQAFANQGDALTIDDATVAGLRAALLAREHGHRVTWFVNGRHVQEGLPYFPFQLSHGLDNGRKDFCVFRGKVWRLRRADDRRAFRLHLKQIYMRIKRWADIQKLLLSLSQALDTDCSTIEPGLQTVTAADLSLAAAAGVDLQNHCWCHLNPTVLTEKQLRANLHRNREYLSQFRESAVHVVAPPFGAQLDACSTGADFVLLSTKSIQPDYRLGKTANRCDLHFQPPKSRHRPYPVERRKIMAAASVHAT